MSYKYDMFEHLLRLWMGIWLPTHTITTKDISPDLGKLAEILPDASVQTMPLRFGWGCRTFQTAFYVHVIHIWGVWATSQVVDGHMASHSHRHHHRHFPRVVGVGWNLTWCKCAKPCHYALVEAVEPFKLHPMSMSYIYEVFEHLLRFWMGIWLHTHTITITDVSPDLWELAEILPDASVQTMPLHFGWGCRTFQTASHSAYGFTLTPLPPQTFPQIFESRLKSYLMHMCKPCHYALVEAVEPYFEEQKTHGI